MGNQVNYSSIWCCLNVYRIDVYEHDKEYKKEILNEEWESYGMMSHGIVSNLLLSYEPLDIVQLMFPLEYRVVF